MKVCPFGETRLLQDSAFFVGCYECYMGVSKNMGTPNWMILCCLVTSFCLSVAKEHLGT